MLETKFLRQFCYIPHCLIYIWKVFWLAKKWVSWYFSGDLAVLCIKKIPLWVRGRIDLRQKPFSLKINGKHCYLFLWNIKKIKNSNKVNLQQDESILYYSTYRLSIFCSVILGLIVIGSLSNSTIIIKTHLAFLSLF